MENYDWLIARIDTFIRKYYANKVMRGSLIFLSCLLFYVLTASVGEYYLYLPVAARVSILTTFLALGLSSLVAWVIIPAAKMYRLGSVISHEQAATIIGTHFPEVSDKLLNILQLKKHEDGYASRELAEASINQKIKQIAVVPVTSAIDFSRNKKYLPYLLPLLLIGVFILVAAPSVFKESATRLLQPTKYFEKPAPFQFIIKNQKLTVVRNADFVLEVTVTGNTLPADVFVELGGERIPMQQAENHHFKYTFKNVTDSVNFRFYGGGFYSSENTLKVLQKPVLKAFRVAIDYPAYTGIKNEVRNSLGDITVPAGSKLHWLLNTEHTDAATLRLGHGSTVALTADDAAFTGQFTFMNDTAYTITLANNTSGVHDSFTYQVQVIPDQYPVIQVEQHKDSVTARQVLLTGTAGDDYGITRVTFNYEVTDKEKIIENKKLPLSTTAGALTTFKQYFDIEALHLTAGQKVTYYVEAWDNDGVHGSKASRSEVMSFQMYNANQRDSAMNENAQQINSGMSNSAQQSKQLQNDYSDMQNKLLQSSDVDWQQQQSLQEMMNKQMQLKNQMENIKQRFEEQKQQSEQKQYSDDLRDKQKDMEKQIDNLMNNELKEEMKKLQELMQKLNKDQAVDAMQQLQQENKLFNMDMQRMQELMKKMELQMRMEDMANKMDELAQKEDKLNKETDKMNSENDKNKTDNDKSKADNDKNKTDSKDKDDKMNKGDDSKKSDDAKKSDDSQKSDDAKKSADDAKKADDSTKGNDSKKSGDDAKKSDDNKKADDAQKKGDDAKKSDAGRKTDDKKTADNAKKSSDNNKKSDDAKKAASDAKKTPEQLSQEQKDIKAAMEKVMKEDMKDMEKLGKEAKQDGALDEPKEQGEKAEKEMDESSKDLDEKQKSSASKAQKQAEKNLQDMAKSLRQKAQEGSDEEVEIDIKMTRQILSNLIRLSFDQENLISAVKSTPASSPQYLDNQHEQNRLRSNAHMVRDSLFELSKRVSKLSAKINEETMNLEQSMTKAVDGIENRTLGFALTNEQYAMTYTNNLALTLDELLANLIQMQNQGPSMGSCPNPGGKKPGKSPGQQLSDIITEQQQVGDKMGKMPGGKKPGSKGNEGQAGKEGNKPGGQQGKGSGQGKPGEGQPGGSGQGSGEGQGENGDAEQIARLAEEQANIRRKIQELSSLLNSKGMNGAAKELREVEQNMDKNETDMVNRKLNSELMMRQKEILSRLLEADKAVREQEQDDKRASNSGKEMSRPIPDELQKYITDQKKLMDFYKTVPPQLKPYYKEMVESYFHIIGEK